MMVCMVYTSKKHIKSKSLSFCRLFVDEDDEEIEFLLSKTFVFAACFFSYLLV